MTDEKPHPHVGPLTDSQRTRIEFARRDFESARAADLSQLDAAGLILLVERLRTRLDDVLNLTDELTAEPPTSRA
ncbi:hypothetical protein QQY66_44630 [Streptomyces sp. DG2A-72]|uniref:hypothetical protein n=1 Tax=Streptomyces sp. DG2A-72 TaxID=3051386 RepID=UPI00265C0100|nr:hypothetical protein [Streptomyces sp. DG2A-72]MDO0938471.1 hypothetical protein [Streptomyces sp. DG2A-72]